MKNSSVTPFVKWAGGKRQLLTQIRERMPETYNNYFEPFVGGGAVVFELLPEKAVINDINKALINAYKQICDDPESFISTVTHLDSEMWEDGKKYYYALRERYNDKLMKDEFDIELAALFVFINKHCFNGLYRVNSKNEFNVPFGKKTKVNTYEGDNLITVSNYLTMNDVRILCCDFEDAVINAKKGDFVYFDPPYDSDTATFNSYTEDGFGKDEQRRLAKVFKDLDSCGCYVMLSNHNTHLVNDLYNGYNIHVIEAKRNINANANGRGNVEEVIITNYVNDLEK